MKYRDLLKQLHDDGWQHIRTTQPPALQTPDQAGSRHGSRRRQTLSRHRSGNFAFHSSPSRIKMMNVNYTVIIEPADDGTFSVYVPDLPGCVSTGTTRDDAIDSIREAIAGHIQTLRDLGEPVPPPRSQSQVVAA
jgi:predicted RNase H-like HicB family nuclease